MSSDANLKRSIDLLFIESMYNARASLKEISEVTGYSMGHISILARLNKCRPRHGGALYGYSLENMLLRHSRRRRKHPIDDAA